MSFSNPAFQRRIQRINAQTGGVTSSPGLHRKQQEQAARDQAGIDMRKQIMGEEFAGRQACQENMLGLGEKKLGLAIDRLGLQKKQQDFDFGMRNEYLGMQRDQIKSAMNQTRIRTYLGLGQMGLQGYYGYRDRQRARAEQQAMAEQRAMQLRANEEQIAMYKRMGVK